MRNYPNDFALKLVENAKEKIINKTDDLMVEMILYSMNIYRFRYEYDGQQNEVSFFFGKYDIIMNYSIGNKSDFQVLKVDSKDENGDEIEDYETLFEIDNDISNIKYNSLSEED